jgi:electron transfer flavoprotein beta subunit
LKSVDFEPFRDVENFPFFRGEAMKILVTAKRVEDPESKIRVKPDGTGIVTDGVSYKINPFDEIAVEEALRLVATHQGEVVAVSIGPDKVVTEIRHALAMGAARGIWVKHDGALDADAVARVLKAVVDKEKPDLVLLGKQSIDDDQNQVGQLLAEQLGWGQVAFASKLDSLESDKEKARTPALEVTGQLLRAMREVDGGIEIVEADLPCVVTADLRLNKPRYATLPGIAGAKRKPVAEMTPQALGVDISPKVKVLSLSAPPVRKAGVKVPDAATLYQKLKTDAKVL